MAMRWTIGGASSRKGRSKKPPEPYQPCVVALCEPRVLLAAVAAELPEGLVGYWPLDAIDVSGNIVNDRSGKDRNGTLIGDPTFAAGRRRDAINLDGVDDRVDVGNLLPGGAAQLSVAAWVSKTDSTTNGFIIAKASSASPSDPAYAWSLGVAGTVVQVGLQTSQGVVTFDGPTIEPNRWSHVAFTYDGSAVNIYLNGRLRRTYAQAGSVAPSDAHVTVGGSDSL